MNLLSKRLLVVAGLAGAVLTLGLWLGGAQASHNTNCTDANETDTIPCGSNGIAIDADTATAGIQSTRVVGVGQTFQIGIVMVDSNHGVAGMEVQVATLDPFVDEVDTSIAPTAALLGAGHGCGPAGAVATGPSPNDNSHITCTAAAGAPMLPLATLFTLDAQCLEPGTGTLHLVTGVNAENPNSSPPTADEDLIFGNAHLFSANDFIPLHLQDASVTCVLDLEKEDGQPGTGTYLAGQTVTWTITIDDAGIPISFPGAPLTDTVPAPLTNVNIVSSSGGPLDNCSVAANTVTCASPFIIAGSGFTLVISADIPLSAAGQTNICNTASQQGGDSDTDCINVAPASVSVTKTADASSYFAGDPISWTITVTSNGPSPAADVEVTDTPTDGWAISGISQVSGPACTLSQPNSANCGTLNAGDVVVLQVSGTVDSPAPADSTCNDSVSVTTSNANNPSASAVVDCRPPFQRVQMIKDIDGDPFTDDSLQNLWICLGPTCTNNGEGFLDIQEFVIPATATASDPDGVGAFEFQLKFDHKAFDITITPTNWLYSTGRIPGAPGIGGCAVTIVLENDIRFGCVSKDDPNTPGIQTGVNTPGAAAIIHVTPEPDLVHRITPGQRNGQVRVLLNENCELADIFGDPLSDGVDQLGRPILLPGIVTGGIVEDCLDMVITVRMLEGDLNLDCTVDLADDQQIAKRFGASFGNLAYDPFYDLEPPLKDFDVDIKDVQKVFGRNGSTCQNPIPAQPPEQAAPNGPNP